jgi:putative ABC transport system permease protein
MILMIPLSYNVRSLFVRKATTIATALGIALVVFVLACSFMLSSGIKKTMINAGRADNAIVLRKGSDAEIASSIETKTVGVIQAAPGVKKDSAGAPLGSGEVVVVIALDKLGGDDGQVSNVQVRGVTEAARRVRPELRVTEGTWPRPGTDEVIIGKGIAGRFKGLDLGGTFELKKNRPVRVVGIFEADGTSLESEIWVDADVARSSFGREGVVSSVTLRLESPTKFDAFKAAMENDKQLGLEALQERKYYETQSQGTSLFITAIGAVISFFFSIGAMIGATITMHAAIAQRQREIGTLRALGFSRLSILGSFLLESVMLALIGGVVGLVAALCMSFASFSMVNFATWQEITFKFDPDPGALLVCLLIGGVMGVVGGFFPALRAARVSPIEAMRG